MIPAEFEPALEGGYIIAGSASTVRDRLKDNEIAGINYLCRLAFGDLSFEDRRARSSFWRRSDAGALDGACHPTLWSLATLKTFPVIRLLWPKAPRTREPRTPSPSARHPPR